MSDAIENTSLTPAWDALSDREKIVVSSYTNPNSDTHLVKSASAMQAYKCSTVQSASAMGIEVLNRPKVSLAIREAFANQGITNEVFTKQVADLMLGKMPDITKSYKDEDGVYITESTKAADRARGMKLYADLSGIQAEAEAYQSVAERKLMETIRAVERGEGV